MLSNFCETNTATMASVWDIQDETNFYKTVNQHTDERNPSFFLLRIFLCNIRGDKNDLSWVDILYEKHPIASIQKSTSIKEIIYLSHKKKRIEENLCVFFFLQGKGDVSRRAVEPAPKSSSLDLNTNSAPSQVQLPLGSTWILGPEFTPLQNEKDNRVSRRSYIIGRQ